MPTSVFETGEVSSSMVVGKWLPPHSNRCLVTSNLKDVHLRAGSSGASLGLCLGIRIMLRNKNTIMVLLNTQT